MPLDISTTTGGDVYAAPFIGPTDFRATVNVTPADLTADEVDSDGVLKPGVPLKQDGTLADATAGEFIFGVVVEATPIAEGNAAADLSAAGDIDVAVVTIGQINRAIAEDNLGRALTANEVAALDAAGSRIVTVE